MGGRCALYWAMASMRCTGLPASKAHTTASGEAISMNLQSMVRKPKTALVGMPSLAVMGVCTAW